MYPGYSKNNFITKWSADETQGNGICWRKYSHFVSIQFPPVLPRNYLLSTHNKEKIISL